MLNQLTTLLILAALAICNANDLVYFEPGACNFNRNHVGCYGFAAGGCCSTQRPFCGSMACGNCARGTTTWNYLINQCGFAAPGNACTQGGDDWCCTNLGDVNSCSGIWFGPWKRDEMAGNCTGSVEPNKMVFTDDDGVAHEIHMPEGTFTAASGHYQGQNWAELRQFPAWANQTYEEANEDAICHSGL